MTSSWPSKSTAPLMAIGRRWLSSTAVLIIALAALVTMPMSAAGQTSGSSQGGITALPLSSTAVPAAADRTAELGLITAIPDALRREGWRGTPAGDAVALIKQLPLAGSAAKQTLLLALLAGQSPAPDGAEATFLSARLDALAQRGGAPALIAMAADPRLVNAMDEPAKARLTDHLLRQGATEAACTLVADALTQHGSADWQRRATGCDLLNGETGAGLFGLEILREDGEAGPFMTLASAVAGTGPAPNEWPDAAALTAIERRLAQQLGLIAPADAGHAALAALKRASEPSTPDPARAIAAFAAAGAGLLDGDALAAVLTEINTPVLDLATITDAATPLQRVALWQGAEAEPLDIVRVEWVALGAAHARSLTEAALYTPLIQPDTVSDWLAPALAPVTLARGTTDVGLAWALLTPPAQQVQLWPLLALATAEREAPPPALGPISSRWAALGDRRNPRDLQLLVAAGLLPQPANWTAVWLRQRNQAEQTQDRTPSPPSSLADPGLARRALADAAARGQVAATVALALIMLGDAPAGVAPTENVAAAIAALRQVGLTQSAYAIALEDLATQRRAEMP